ncbi:MAG: diheme cytochrome c-553, partial [Thermoanaerobaculia bacterium]
MNVRSVGSWWVACAVCCLGWTACSPPPSAEETPGPVAAVEAAVPAEPVARGEYLVTIMSCNDCHTPLTMGPEGPAPDMSRMLSGHPEGLVMPPPPALGDGPWQVVMAGSVTAFAGPWGVSYAANLTPDASGLAAWDEATFVNAMRTGKHFGTS